MAAPSKLGFDQRPRNRTGLLFLYYPKRWVVRAVHILCTINSILRDVWFAQEKTRLSAYIYSRILLPLVRLLQGGDAAKKESEFEMIEDVHDAVADLVQIVKIYQSRNKVSQVLMSTLFKRRQEEAEAVIDRAIWRLNVSPFVAHESRLSHQIF